MPPYNEEDQPTDKEIDLDQLNTINKAISDIEYNIRVFKSFPKGPNNREKALVITKLEEAVLWAKRDIELHHKL